MVSLDKESGGGGGAGGTLSYLGPFVNAPAPYLPRPQLVQEHELEMDIFFGLTGAISLEPRTVDLPNGRYYLTLLSAEVPEDFDLSSGAVQYFGSQVCTALYTHPKIRHLAGFCFFLEFHKWLEKEGMAYPLRKSNTTEFAWVVWRFVAERNLWKYVAFNHFVEGHPELKVCVRLLITGIGPGLCFGAQLCFLSYSGPGLTFVQMIDCGHRFAGSAWQSTDGS